MLFWNLFYREIPAEGRGMHWFRGVGIDGGDFWQKRGGLLGEPDRCGVKRKTCPDVGVYGRVRVLWPLAVRLVAKAGMVEVEGVICQFPTTWE